MIIVMFAISNNAMSFSVHLTATFDTGNLKNIYNLYLPYLAMSSVDGTVPYMIQRKPQYRLRLKLGFCLLYDGIY